MKTEKESGRTQLRVGCSLLLCRGTSPGSGTLPVRVCSGQDSSSLASPPWGRSGSGVLPVWGCSSDGAAESRVSQVRRVLGPGCPGPRRTGSGVRAPRRARGTGSCRGAPRPWVPGSGSLEPGAEGAEEAAARGGAPRSPKLASGPRGQEGARRGSCYAPWAQRAACTTAPESVFGLRAFAL